MIRTFGLTLCLALMTFLFVSASSAARAQQFQTAKSASDRVLGGEVEGARWSVCFEDPDKLLRSFGVLQRDSVLQVKAGFDLLLVNYLDGRIFHSWDHKEFHNAIFPAAGNAEELLRVASDRPSLGAHWFLRSTYAAPLDVDTIAFSIRETFSDSSAWIIRSMTFLPGSRTRLLLHFNETEEDYEESWTGGWLTIVDLDDPNGNASRSGMGDGRFWLLPNGRFCITQGYSKVFDFDANSGESRDIYSLCRIEGNQIISELSLPEFISVVIEEKSGSFLLFNGDRFNGDRYGIRYSYDTATDSWAQGSGYFLEPFGFLTPYGTHYIQLNKEQTALEMVEMSTGLTVAECEVRLPGPVEEMLKIPGHNIVLFQVEARYLVAIELCEDFLFASGLAGESERPVKQEPVLTVRQTEDIVQVHNRSAAPACVTVCNMRGSLVHQQTLSGGMTGVFNTDGWPRGIYVVYCSDHGMQSGSLLVVK